MIQNNSIGSEWLRTHKTMMVLIVVVQKMVVAISNTFYVILCPILVHILKPGTSDETYTQKMFRSSGSDKTMQNVLALINFFLNFLKTFLWIENRENF